MCPSSLRVSLQPVSKIFPYNFPYTLNPSMPQLPHVICRSPLSLTSPSFRPFLTPPSSFPSSPLDSPTPSLLIPSPCPPTSWAPPDPLASPYAPVSLMLPLDPATSNVILIPSLYQFWTLLIPLPTFLAPWSAPSSNRPVSQLFFL